LVDPRSLDRLIAALLADTKAGVATLAWPVRSRAEWESPDVVKVAVAPDGTALYFSRAAIPFDRARPGRVPRGALKHIGIYGFRRAALLRFAGWGPSPLEELE